MALLMNLVEEATHWRLSVHGDLESGALYEFRTTAGRILASELRAGVVDLSNLGRLDQAGLGALVEMSHEHAAAGRQLVFVTSRTVDQLLCDTRLQGIFSTAQTMAGATGMLAGAIQATPQGAVSTA